MAESMGGQLWETPVLVILLGFAPFPTLLPPSIKHHYHPLGCHIQMFLLPTAEEGKDAGERQPPYLAPGRAGTATRASPCLPAPSTPPSLKVCPSLPRDDSDAEEDWLTLKAMSESLSSWEPLRDPDGDVVAGLDCRVPETKETPSGAVGGGLCSASPWLSTALHLHFLMCLMGGQELPHRVLLRTDGIVHV